jgi:hypothetical protein
MAQRTLPHHLGAQSAVKRLVSPLDHWHLRAQLLSTCESYKYLAVRQCPTEAHANRKPEAFLPEAALEAEGHKDVRRAATLKERVLAASTPPRRQHTTEQSGALFLRTRWTSFPGKKKAKKQNVTFVPWLAFFYSCW